MGDLGEYTAPWLGLLGEAGAVNCGVWVEDLVEEVETLLRVLEGGGDGLG